MDLIIVCWHEQISFNPATSWILRTIWVKLSGQAANAQMKMKMKICNDKNQIKNEWWVERFYQLGES